MNQDKKKIEVILQKNNKDDVLKFCFEKELYISLINDDNNKLKDVFQNILEELEKEQFVFDFKIEDGYSVDLYKEVGATYIQQLNNEIVELVNSDDWKEVFG